MKMSATLNAMPHASGLLNAGNVNFGSSNQPALATFSKLINPNGMDTRYPTTAPSRIGSMPMSPLPCK